ncbi:MAG: MATE family efflux transporter [Mucinivorans sp.]
MKELLPYYKSNMRLALPVIISQVGGMTVTLVDTIMVGHLGAEPLAGVSFANSLVWPIFLLGTGIAMGLTPLAGVAYARGDKRRLSSLLANSFMMNMVIGIIFTLIIIGISMLMGHMGQDESILDTARGYMYYQVASMIPMMLFATGKQFLEGMGNTLYAMAITITANIVNVVLNFALIYGLWIFPEMGAIGAGASTFIARCLMVVLFIMVFVYRSNYRFYLNEALKEKLCKFRLRRLLNVGFPISIQLFIEMSALGLMAIVMGTFGAQTLAAHQIAINIPSMSFMVVVGLAAATTIRVSQDNGLRLYQSMRVALKASLHLIIAFMTLSAILIFSLASQIASIFTSDPEVIAMAANFLFFGALFQLSDGIQGVVLGGLRGIMVVKWPMFYAIGTYIFVGVPVGYFCIKVLNMGPTGAWVGFITSLTILATLYFRLFKKKTKLL